MRGFVQVAGGGGGAIRIRYWAAGIIFFKAGIDSKGELR